MRAAGLTQPPVPKLAPYYILASLHQAVNSTAMCHKL